MMPRSGNLLIQDHRAAISVHRFNHLAARHRERWRNDDTCDLNLTCIR